MRRSSTDRRGKPPHQAGSVTGDDGDFSDLESSETGSFGGTTGGSAKKHMTIEQREAAYNEARSRIFMGFEEKEKAKDKEINSSSSSLSIASGGKNGGGSAGDVDSSSSSPATESEWSGPVLRGERRQNSGHASASSSTRSVRSPAYVSNGSGSSRNSRAASPSSLHYLSPYDQNVPSMPLYDPSQHQHQHPTPTAPIYHPPYGYPYSQGQSNPPYMLYAYYASYTPYSSPHQLQPASDPATSSNGESYAPPLPMSYGPTYMWPHPGQPPVQSPPMQPPSVQSQQLPLNMPHTMSPPPPGQPPYPPYVPPSHSYTYPIPGYYPNQPQPGHPMVPPPLPGHPSHISGPQQPFHNKSPNNGTGNNMQTNGFRNGMIGNNSHRPPPRNEYNGSSVGSGPKSRVGGGTAQPGRAPGSYGPGSGGMLTNSSQANETVGPRLSKTRRQSNMSNSSINGRSTSGDDVSSVAVRFFPN